MIVLVSLVFLTFCFTHSLGEVVCALFEGEWYRGEVMGPADDGGYIVKYIEYGNIENVKPSDIMPAGDSAKFDVCGKDFFVDSKLSFLNSYHLLIIDIIFWLSTFDLNRFHSRFKRQAVGNVGFWGTFNHQHFESQWRSIALLNRRLLNFWLHHSHRPTRCDSNIRNIS